MMTETEKEDVRGIVRDEVRRTMIDELSPYRAMLNRIRLDLYGENPDGSRAHDAGLLKLTERNNVLLWFVLAISCFNAFAFVVFLFLDRIFS